MVSGGDIMHQTWLMGVMSKCYPGVVAERHMKQRERGETDVTDDGYEGGSCDGCYVDSLSTPAHQCGKGR